MQNIDKIGFRIRISKAYRIIIFNLKTKAYTPSETNRNYITSIKAVLVVSNSISSMLILQAKQRIEKQYSKLKAFIYITFSNTSYINN